MPKKGPHPQKMNKITRTLRENPQGIWIREIARRTGISKSTVHLYINRYMENEIEEALKIKGNLIRFVRLKK